MWRRRMGGIAEHQHPPAMPWRRQQEGIHRSVVHPARVGDGLADIAHHRAVEVGKLLLQDEVQAVGRQAAVVGDRLHQEQEHLVARMRIDAGLGARAKEHLHAVHLGRALHGRAPHREAGEVRLRHRVEHHVAHHGADAVAADDEVVGAARAVGERHVDAVRPLRERRRRDAKPNAGTRSLRRAQQHVMQRRASDRHGRRVVRPIEPGHVERADLSAVRVGEGDAVEAERHGDAGIEESDRLQRPERRPGQADADAEDVPLRLQLDDLGREPLAPERHREGEPGDPAADDEDLGFRRHVPDDAAIGRSGQDLTGWPA